MISTLEQSLWKTLYSAVKYLYAMWIPKKTKLTDLRGHWILPSWNVLAMLFLLYFCYTILQQNTFYKLFDVFLILSRPWIYVCRLNRWNRLLGRTLKIIWPCVLTFSRTIYVRNSLSDPFFKCIPTGPLPCQTLTGTFVLRNLYRAFDGTTKNDNFVAWGVYKLMLSNWVPKIWGVIIC